MEQCQRLCQVYPKGNIRGHSRRQAGKAAIEAMQSDAVPDALRKFQATLSLPDALAYINRYETQKAETLRKEEERRRQEEERRHQAEIERIRQKNAGVWPRRNVSVEKP